MASIGILSYVRDDINEYCSFDAINEEDPDC